MKIPLVVTGPNIPKNRRIDTPVYLQDVMPTTLEIAGRNIPKHIQFQNLLPLARKEKKAGHDTIYGAYMDRQRMVRKGDFKLIVYPKGGTVLLYDLKNDPEERHNLSTNPEYVSKIAELKDELKRLQAETGDPLELNY